MKRLRALPYVLIVILALGALRALLGDGDPGEERGAGLLPESSPGDVSGTSEQALQPAPLLDTAPEGRGQRAPLPPAIRAAADRPFLDQNRRRLLAWIREDARRLLDVLAYAGRCTPAGSDPLIVTWRYAAANAGALKYGIPQVHDTVDDALLHAALPARVIAGLLALLDVRAASAAVRARLRELAAAPGQAPTLRLLICRVLLQFGDMTPAEDALLGEVLRADVRYDRAVTTSVLAMLARRGTKARSLMPAVEVRAARKGETWGVRQQALQALIELGGKGPQMREALVRLMRAPDLAVRRQARERLFRDGHFFDGDVDETLRWLEQAPVSVQIQGATVLLQRGVDATLLRPFVMRALASKQAPERRRALAMIAVVKPAVSEVMPILQAHLDSDDTARHMAAVKGLSLVASLEGSHDAALQMLSGVLRAPDAKLRAAAVQAILVYDQDADAVIDVLSGLLRDDNAAVRMEAVDGLGELTAEHPEARRALEAARNDPASTVRELVAYWLDGPRTPEGH